MPLNILTVDHNLGICMCVHKNKTTYTTDEISDELHKYYFYRIRMNALGINSYNIPKGVFLSFKI